MLKVKEEYFFWFKHRKFESEEELTATNTKAKQEHGKWFKFQPQSKTMVTKEPV